MSSDPIVCRIAAMGDIMLSRDVGRHFSERPRDFDFADLGPLLKSYDLVFANLETPVAVGGEPHNIQDSHVTFRSSPETLAVLKNLNISAVFLGNNHMLDYGPKALEETLRHLDSAEIKYCGAGRNYEEANRPLVIEHGGRRLAVLSLVFIYSASTLMARNGQAGVSDYRIKRVLRTIRQLKQTGHYVIVAIHWGMEYSLYPLPYQMKQARRMIDNGASLILGHGPHYPQGIEHYRDGTIVYSLGNFIFDEPYKFANRSFIYGIGISEKGKTCNPAILPVHIVNHVPALVHGQKKERLAKLIASLSKAYVNRNKMFWKDINNVYCSDIAGRVIRMKSLKFVMLPPVSFYFSIGTKNLLKKLKLRNIMPVVNLPVKAVARALKNATRSAIPQDHRKTIALWLKRNRWLPVPNYWAAGLISDLKTTDPKTFHKLLWAHHFDSYARWYDSESLFGADKMNGSTRTCQEFFSDLTAVIEELAIDPSREIRSILEVGCSLGYILRFIESTKFPSATDLLGIDIDREAIKKGSRYLADVKSRVRLICGDMENLEYLVRDQRFDFTYATGVFSYLNGSDASRVIGAMMARTSKILALVGLANRDFPNGELPESRLAGEHGNQWIHNFEPMISGAGGRVVKTRWEVSQSAEKKGLYFVFAEPRD